MTASLPSDVQAVFDRFITTELTTVDSAGQPITWPVTPYYRPGDPCIDVTTGPRLPEEGQRRARQPARLAAVLRSDRERPDDPPMVLVQGSAEVDDQDLDANRERYARESAEKLPGASRADPPEPFKRFFSWYFTRIYVHVRPERIYVWPPGRRTPSRSSTTPTWRRFAPATPRSPSGSTPPPRAAPAPGTPGCTQLGSRLPDRRAAIVSPDGFPFSMRVPVQRRRGQPLDPDRRAARGARRSSPASPA